MKGFTLLEVMVSLLILAIGLLGVAALGTTSIRSNANANHLSEALNIGQAELEKLKITAWGTIANGTSTATSKTGVIFTNTCAVTTIGNVKDVRLVIAWHDGTHFIEMRTKVAR